METPTPGGEGAGSALVEPLKALEELDHLQDVVVEAMSTAAEAIRELSEHDEERGLVSETSIQDKLSDFVDMMKEVHSGLASKAHLMRNYVPYNRDCSSLRREVDVLKLRLSLLKQELGEAALESPIPTTNGAVEQQEKQSMMQL